MQSNFPLRFFSVFTALVISICDYGSQEKRVDKATLEMEPEYPPKYFDDLAADLCSRERKLHRTINTTVV